MGKVNKGGERHDNVLLTANNGSVNQIADLYADSYKRQYDIVAEQATSIAKWLTASLFAINSGGIITILNLLEKLSNPAWISSLFISGTIFAMLNAAVNQELYMRMSTPVREAILYWSEVKITGQQDHARIEKIESNLRSVQKFSWIGPTCGWISGLMFISGTISVALSMKLH